MNIISNEDTLNIRPELLMKDLTGCFTNNEVINKLLIRRIVFRNRLYVFNPSTFCFEAIRDELHEEGLARYRSLYFRYDARLLKETNKLNTFFGYIDGYLSVKKVKIEVSFNTSSISNLSVEARQEYFDRNWDNLDTLSISNVQLFFCETWKPVERIEPLTFIQMREDIMSLMKTCNYERYLYCLENNTDPRIVAVAPYLVTLLKNKIGFVMRFKWENWEAVCFANTIRFELDLINNLCRNGDTLDDILQLSKPLYSSIWDNTDLCFWESCRLMNQEHRITDDDIKSGRAERLAYQYPVKAPKWMRNLFEDIH